MIKKVFLSFILGLLLGSCSIPDLSDPDVFSEAKLEAIDLKSLQRKFMYGMFHLFIDSKENPFSGWVKTTNRNDQLTELGYLYKGRKEGLWISWDENGTKISEIYWTEDRMEGNFSLWHSNGLIKVLGQTRDGEVDGQWTEFYSHGKIACKSINHTGHLVKITVWKPDGRLCQESNVTKGNGSFWAYWDDGRIKEKRIFAGGVETSRKIFNQR